MRFFQADSTSRHVVHVGANRLKKPHHIVILRFGEVVKAHANYNYFSKWRVLKEMWNSERMKWGEIKKNLV